MAAAGEGKRVQVGRRRAGDGAVSAVLGAILMLAVLMTLVPGMILLRNAISEEMDAQREGAERAAWCARNPSIGPPACEEAGPMPGYECTEVELGAWLCTVRAQPATPTHGGPPPTATPATPILPTPMPS